jgi:hypothetical protein
VVGARVTLRPPTNQYMHLYAYGMYWALFGKRCHAIFSSLYGRLSVKPEVTALSFSQFLHSAGAARFSAPAQAQRLPRAQDRSRPARRAAAGLVFAGPSHAGASRRNDFGTSLTSFAAPKTAKPYIRLARIRAQPISRTQRKDEAVMDGTNLLAGMRAPNGPGHASLPVRRARGVSQRFAGRSGHALSVASWGIVPRSR